MKRKIIISFVVVALLILLAGVAVWGFHYGIEPIIHLEDASTFMVKGNAGAYSLKNTEKRKSPLEGKEIIFLGSSVTYGAKSMGVSFVDYLEKRDGVIATKEAVSGTTLVDTGSTSYVSRLKSLDNEGADMLVCQLSTNDAKKLLPLGEISASTDINDFDTSTVAGAMEFVIAYSRDKWNCPIVFFTNPKYDNEQYEKMISLLYQLQKKWGITIIDLWNDTTVSDMTEEERSLYMYDAIHPTKAGYLTQWTPAFENELEKQFIKNP